jgi:glycosyltransferase involved in cell wall biosynthesis
MRVGAFVPVIEDQPAGLGKYCHEVLGRLSGTVGSLTIWSQKGIAAWPGAVTSNVAATTSSLGLEARARRLAWLSRPVVRRFDRDTADVGFFPAQEGPLVPLRIPSCIVIHDLIPLKHAANRRIDAMQMRTLLSRMVRLADRVICVSESTKVDVLDCLRGIRAEEIMVIPEGIDHAIFFPRDNDVSRDDAVERQSTPYLLYSGTLATHKNVELLLPILADAHTADAPLRLLVTGRSRQSDVDRFMNVAEYWGVSNRVELLGYVPMDHLARLMSATVAFVFPSRYEGFGLAPLEAMACGAPVISSNAGSLPEVVGAGGTLLDPDDGESWRAHVLELAADPARRASDSARAVQHAARFTWEVTVERVSRALEDLV